MVHYPTEMTEDNEIEDEYDEYEDEDGKDLEVHYSKDNENKMVNLEDDDDEIIMEDKKEIPGDLTLGMFCYR